MMAWTYASLPALSDRQFSDWQQLIEMRTGIDFSQHRSILQSGLTRRLRELGIDDYDAYFAHVLEQPGGLAEWQQLIDFIAVKETSFFRQPAAFAAVREHLQQRIKNARALDLWSVGCASGEEAFSLAMVASDVIEGSGARCFLGVLATDMCGVALQQARLGRYKAKRLDTVPDALRQRYFRADGDGFYQAATDLRQRICFAQANVLEIEQLPALPMDVIFCQNMLVYFRRWRIKQILDALAERLKPGGLMVLGPGEAPFWQHPAMVRTAHRDVTAWLRRVENN